jgi:hypothetical protein
VNAEEPSPITHYIERRLKPQLAWYEQRALTSKRWRHALASVQIVATVAIPVVNVFAHSISASSVLAGIAALATSFEGLFGHQDRWLAYRQTARALETLLLRYELGLAPYDGSDKPDRLISDAEAVLDGEGAKWAEGVKQRGAGGRAPNIFLSN